MKFWNKHRSWILNAIWVAAPVVAGVVAGGVFTAPAIITAVGVIAGKLARSPLKHDTPEE